MEKSLDRRFGEALKALREQRGKSQEEITSTGRTYLSELERGLKTPTLETIVRLAQELGVSPANLVAAATRIPPVPPGTAGAQSERFDDLLNRAMGMAETHEREAVPVAVFSRESTLAEVVWIAQNKRVGLARLLADAALLAFREMPDQPSRTRRDELRFVLADKRPEADLQFATDGPTDWSFSPEIALQALRDSNRTLELAADVLGMNNVPFFRLLGMRNLGSFLGAVYAYSMQALMADRLMVNPHQDGYPDLCALTAKGREYIESVTRQGLETAKRSFAKYEFGGVEIKTTCGSVPTPRKGRPKPQIGDQRSHQLTGADWKAHHRDTNNLLGLYWDFISGLPTVLGLFYSRRLTPADWGAIVLPKKEEGAVVSNVEGEGEVEIAVPLAGQVEGKKKRKAAGHTTSVSIMTDDAVRKMAKGWIVLPADEELLRGMAKRTVFDLRTEDVKAFASEAPHAILDALTAARDQPTRTKRAEAKGETVPKKRPRAGKKLPSAAKAMSRVRYHRDRWTNLGAAEWTDSGGGERS